MLSETDITPSARRERVSRVRDASWRIFLNGISLIPDSSARRRAPAGIKVAFSERAFALLHSYIYISIYNIYIYVSAAPFPGGLPKSYALISTNARALATRKEISALIESTSDFHPESRPRYFSAAECPAQDGQLWRGEGGEGVRARRQISGSGRSGAERRVLARNLTVASNGYLRGSSSSAFPGILRDIPLSSLRSSLIVQKLED